MTIIRIIEERDNAAVASIIREVMPEFGAGGAGFAIHDQEVDNMYDAYSKSKCGYVVCEENGIVVGGAGIAPLAGGDGSVCELKKMYFKRDGRGQGYGQLVLQRCISMATDFGYEKCYLETFNTMTGAMKLYEKNGFHIISGPLGNTGHFACDRFYILKLEK